MSRKRRNCRLQPNGVRLPRVAEVRPSQNSSQRQRLTTGPLRRAVRRQCDESGAPVRFLIIAAKRHYLPVTPLLGRWSAVIDPSKPYADDKICPLARRILPAA